MNGRVEEAGVRLLGRLIKLGKIGALEGGGVSRLALSDEDKAGRDLVCKWMAELGLEISVDQIGNVWGLREGEEDLPPLVIGSHIDTVATGGLYDGNLGVLAGLEVAATLNQACIQTRRPLAVAFFTNEEGARFAPDMMGSGAATGALDMEEMLATTGIDGTTVGAEVERIGYAGPLPPGSLKPHAFLEYHIEQGPVLESEGLDIGVVTGVQGISWTDFTISGTSSHAGTTPMAMRRDAGLVAAQIACEARAIADEAGPLQVSTVGRVALSPDLVNVVPEQAVLTVDLRHTDEVQLRAAEERLLGFAAAAAGKEGCTLETRSLARFEPVAFDPALVQQIEDTASLCGLSFRRMPSGAGHDAQMFAPLCPTAMIFVPSKDGLSHNTREYTAPEQLAAGLEVLLDVALAQLEPSPPL